MVHEHIWAEQFKLNDDMELEPDGYVCEICGEVTCEKVIPDRNE